MNYVTPGCFLEQARNSKAGTKAPEGTVKARYRDVIEGPTIGGIPGWTDGKEVIVLGATRHGRTDKVRIVVVNGGESLPPMTEGELRQARQEARKEKDYAKADAILSALMHSDCRVEATRRKPGRSRHPSRGR